MEPNTSPEMNIGLTLVNIAHAKNRNQTKTVVFMLSAIAHLVPPTALRATNSLRNQESVVVAVSKRHAKFQVLTTTTTGESPALMLERRGKTEIIVS